MKIKKQLLKNTFIQKILALVFSIYIRFVGLTSSIQYENQKIPEKYWKNDKPFILAFWHSQLMMIGFAWKVNKKLNILASGHSDGRFGSSVANYLNMNNIPTYNKGKKLSLRTIFNLLNKKKYIAITPDGPRGPKESVSEGIIKIAKNAKVPVISIGFWSSKNIKLSSWDSFLVTLPFSKCCFVWNEPLEVPENINEKQIVEYQIILEAQIKESVQKARINCQ